MWLWSFQKKTDPRIFLSINDIQKIDEEEKEGSSIYKIQTADPENIKKQLLKFSLENNINIVSLQSETKSLEEVFRNLTANIQNN